MISSYFENSEVFPFMVYFSANFS